MIGGLGWVRKGWLRKERELGSVIDAFTADSRVDDALVVEEDIPGAAATFSCIVKLQKFYYLVL